MLDDDVSRCDVDRAFCRSCPERCFPDNLDEPKRFDFVQWWAAIRREVGRSLLTGFSRALDAFKT